MFKRSLLALALVVTTSPIALPIAQAAPSTQQCSSGTRVLAEASGSTVSIDGTDVVVTITGPDFTLAAPGGADYRLTGATWCVKSGTKITSGSGVTGSSGSFNAKGIKQAISYLTIFTVTSGVRCFGASGYDIGLTGAADTYQNATQYVGGSATCTGSETGTKFTVVTSDNQYTAFDKCAAIYTANGRGATSVRWFYDEGYGVTDLWFCRP